MARRILLVVLSVAIASFVWFTGGAAEPPTKIQVGVSPVISSAGFYLAQLRGYYTEQNLDVELVPFGKSGPEIIPLVASDQFQVGGGSVCPGMFNALAQGIKVRIVGDKARIDPIKAHDAFLVRQDLVDSGRYKTGADLKGMTIALASPGRTNVLAIGLERYLRKFDLSLDDVNLVGVPFPGQLAAFSGKQIDGACSIEPFITKAEDAGIAKRVWGYEEVSPDYQVAVVFYSEKFATEQRDDAQKFMVAYVKGLRDYINAFRYGKGTDGVIDDLMKVLPVNDRALYTKMAVTGFDPNGYVDAKTVGDAQDWFAAQGLVEKKVSINDIVDNSFCQFAAEQLGPFAVPAK